MAGDPGAAPGLPDLESGGLLLLQSPLERYIRLNLIQGHIPDPARFSCFGKHYFS